MEKKETLLKLIPEQGILPLYFHKDAEVSREVLKVLYKAGIRSVEYTNRGAAALNNFKELRRLCDTELKGMFIGIGTIKTAEAARQYIAEGADFLISPGLVDEVIDVADKHQMLYAPGCMTPTEIIRAENRGIQIIKLFPGNMLGPKYVNDIKAVFPDLLFMPTGGVDLNEENIAAWFKAGVCAVGMGSKLISKDLLELKNYSRIEALTLQALEIIKKVRG